MRSTSNDIRWSPASVSADAVLIEQLSAQLVGDLVVGRLCSACGSSTHGRPWARVGSVEVPVSIARAGEYLVTVVAGEGVSAIGIDVELADPPGALPVPAVADWVALEAVAKAEGRGLDRPVSELTVIGFDGELIGLEAPVGYLAALALRR